MDGGVLAGLGFWKLRLLGIESRTKDFGGTRFKGYTIAASDVNRGRLSASADENGGTSSNVVISRFKVQVQLESLILAQSERWRQA